FGQQALLLPHAVVQVEKTEPRPVARGAVVIPVEQKVAVRIRLQYLAANTDFVEQRPLREREILLATLTDRVANDHAERERIAITVTAKGVGLELERTRGGESEGVDRPGVAKIVVGISRNVFGAAAAEAQSARHVH